MRIEHSTLKIEGLVPRKGMDYKLSQIVLPWEVKLAA
jgi:hypothetical protein